MDKLIEDLLSIEQAANESLAELDEERTAQARLTDAEIARRIQEIKQKASRTIDALKQDAEATVTAELTATEIDYRKKAEGLKELFESNGAIWRKEWAGRILYQS
ncbi:MAG: hypothetical protein FWC77_07400 [Defluviitaleaceae bacterium]|nr:hypothetical protein [Defluviitaleaceae bacterium]